jgi:IS1 family transposase
LAKKNKVWIWTAVDHFREGILEWNIGDRSGNTLKPLWERVKKWKCYFYVTDGWKAYQSFIPNEDQIISKTYMTRVEGENTRLRHYKRQITSKNSLLLKITRNVKAFYSFTNSLS